MNLELFYFEACPFCQMVLSVIDQLDLKVSLLDISSSQEALKRLMTDTGRRTVPCLYIDGNPMFESRDIMAWLQENVDKLKKNS